MAHYFFFIFIFFQCLLSYHIQEEIDDIHETLGNNETQREYLLTARAIPYLNLDLLFSACHRIKSTTITKHSAISTRSSARKFLARAVCCPILVDFFIIIFFTMMPQEDIDEFNETLAAITRRSTSKFLARAIYCPILVAQFVFFLLSYYFEV